MAVKIKSFCIIVIAIVATCSLASCDDRKKDDAIKKKTDISLKVDGVEELSVIWSEDEKGSKTVIKGNEDQIRIANTMADLVVSSCRFLGYLGSAVSTKEIDKITRLESKSEIAFKKITDSAVNKSDFGDDMRSHVLNYNRLFDYINNLSPPVRYEWLFSYSTSKNENTIMLKATIDKTNQKIMCSKLSEVQK